MQRTLKAFLMLLIVATGNYSFFNWSFLVACYALFADGAHSKLSERIEFKCPYKVISSDTYDFFSNTFGRRVVLVGKACLIGIIYGAFAYYFINWFSIRIMPGKAGSLPSVNSKIGELFFSQSFYQIPCSVHKISPGHCRCDGSALADSRRRLPVSCRVRCRYRPLDCRWA